MFNVNKLILVVGLLASVGAAWGTAAAARGRTTVTPHMEVPVRAGQNIVYCSTFQLAWRDMKTDIIKEDIRLEKRLELVDHLNAGRARESDISDLDYFALAGPGGDELVDKINRTLRYKFGAGAPQLDDEYKSGEIILAYSYLNKTLEFEYPFDAFRQPVRFLARSGRVRVEGFGIDPKQTDTHKNLRDQVEIIDYLSYGDFIVRLRSAHPDDEIILAGVPQEKTLAETYQAVASRVKRSNPSPMGESDLLMIPKLSVSLEHSYESLLGLYLLNEGFEEYFVDEARQDVNFNMDEYGVTVNSEARFVLEKKGPAPDHKLLTFNKPFMLYLKKKDGEHPYFMLWVENEELMISGG